MQRDGEITLMLEQWRTGDAGAFEKLAPVVYDHLHQVASIYLLRERPGHTLQATGLVHELFLRLLESKSVSYRDRTHFFTFAAKVMRRILVDYARRNKSQKRGQGAEHLPLTNELAWVGVESSDMLTLNTALDELAELDEQNVRIVELRYFLGATAQETADLLGLSRATVDRSVRFSITWLHHRLTRTGLTRTGLTRTARE